MIVECTRSGYSKHFVECPDTSWQRHDGIAAAKHDVFALRERFTQYFHIHILRQMPTIHQTAGYHTLYPTPCLMGGTGDTFHQTFVVASIYQGMAILSYPSTKFLCHRKIFRVDVIIGRAKNCDMHDF